MKTTKRRAVVIATSTMLAAAGCSLTPKHTITADQALRKIDSYLRETITSIPSSLRFSHREVNIDAGGGCTKPFTGSDFTGQITPSITYTAAAPKADDGEAIHFVNATAAYWTGKSVPVKDRQDDFDISPYKHYRLVVTYYRESHLVELLGVIKDCIWRYGTPQSGDNP